MINCWVYQRIASSFPSRLSHCFSTWSFVFLFLGDTVTSSKPLSELHASWSMPTVTTEAGKCQLRIVTDCCFYRPVVFLIYDIDELSPSILFVWMFCGVRDQCLGFVHGRRYSTSEPHTRFHSPSKVSISWTCLSYLRTVSKGVFCGKSSESLNEHIRFVSVGGLCDWFRFLKGNLSGHENKHP